MNQSMNKSPDLTDVLAISGTSIEPQTKLEGVNSMDTERRVAGADALSVLLLE